MTPAKQKRTAAHAKRPSLSRQANAAYNNYLKSMITLIGSNDVTYNTTLTKLGKQLFGPIFLGAVAHDKQPTTTAGRYAIVNLDTSGMSGSHWVALADNIVYDSFGRLLDFDGYLETEKDAEQAISENNCGQRCLAWLCVFHTLGREAALTI